MRQFASPAGLFLVGVAALSGACTTLLGDFELGGAGGTGASTSSAGGQGGVGTGGGGAGGTGGASGGGGGMGGAAPCTTPCGGGYADCGVCDGVCDTLVLGTDADNCGACGKSCEGGACDAGQCSPVLVADGQQQPVSIVSDGTNLYWLNQGDTSGATGSVMTRRIDLSGAPVARISGQGAPNALVLDGGFLYWTNRNPAVNLMRMEVGGGNPTPLATGNSLVGLATDGDTLFWTDQYANDVRRMALPGLSGSDVLIADGQSRPYGIAVDATYAFWVNESNNTVMWAEKSSMAPIELASGQTGLRSIAVDEKYVYWTYEDAMGGPNAIRRYDRTTMMIAHLGESNAPRDIFVDGEYVYWTDASDSAVFKIHRDGAPMDRQTISTIGPTYAVTADASRLYWSTADSIFKMIK